MYCDGFRRDRVTKADVDLQRYAGMFKPGRQLYSHALVLGIFLDQFRLDGSKIKLDAVFISPRSNLGDPPGNISLAGIAEAE